MILSLIIFVILSVVAAYIASNNLEVIVVSLLGYPVRGPAGVLLVAALGAGILLGIVTMLPALISRSWAVIRHRRKLQELQDQQALMQRKVEKVQKVEKVEKVEKAEMPESEQN